jgi:hypothetical protein
VDGNFPESTTPKEYSGASDNELGGRVYWDSYRFIPSMSTGNRKSWHEHDIMLALHIITEDYNRALL